MSYGIKSKILKYALKDSPIKVTVSVHLKKPENISYTSEEEIRALLQCNHDPNTGAVFTFGRSHFADNEPSHFFIKNDPIVAISCGDEHSAVICQNGRVFVFGGNVWGQLGLGHKDSVSRPSCVKWLKPHRALFVACGRAHTVFVTDTHAVYTVGCNDEGQLGTGDTEHHTVPQYVEIECEDMQVKQVSAGSNHTALLTDNGRVFVCGSNTEGQLGLGEETRICLKFTELKFMEKIAFVECGYYHTVFITADGAVFVTGDNECQKLGITKTVEKIYVPEVLPIDTPIKGACCGASHTFLLSMDETKIFAFGSNEKGQLGMPHGVENVPTPTEIPMDKMFDGFQLKLVACGAMHTAFVTDNGLLYTCGEARHNKLCLDDVNDNNCNDAEVNQYLPKRVTAMNGYIVDNVACGGCHTLLTATKGSNADFTNNDFSVQTEETRQISLTELPPLQKIPVAGMGKPIENLPLSVEDVTNSNVTSTINPDNNGNPLNCEDTDSIDSLEANVSGSHILEINDLNESITVTTIQDLSNDNEKKTDLLKATENLVKTVSDINPVDVIDKAKAEVQTKITEETDTIKKEIEIIEETVVKKMDFIDPGHKCEEIKSLGIPEKLTEIQNSPPPKSPVLEELLHIPNITQLSPDFSRRSDDGQKCESGSKSENETLPCASDKSSPQIGKIAKTQAVLPIVRNEDAIDSTDDNLDNEEAEIVIHKNQDKGRLAKMFQSIRDKENSCMGKGKVIENTVVENVHKGIDTAEETIHKVEETVETEIRNQTNSRTCTIL